MVERQPYKFTCLPFGLSCAPRVFTKIMKPVVSYLRSRGVSLIIIYRRHSDPGIIEGPDETACHTSHSPAGDNGISREVNSGTYTEDSVSGLHCGQPRDEYLFPGGESEEDNSGIEQDGAGMVVSVPHQESSTRDCDLLGWGVTHKDAHIGGAWSSRESSLHINCLELLGAWYVVQRRRATLQCCYGWTTPVR